MFSLCFRMCQITLNVQFVFQNESDRSDVLMFQITQCTVCVSCVRCSDLQFVFQNVSDCSLFSLCFRMCRITLDVQFVFQNVSDCSQCSVCLSKCVRSLLMFSLCF